MNTFRNKISIISIQLFTLALLAYAMPVFADTVKMAVEDRECIVGESLFFSISVTMEQEKEIDVSHVAFKGSPLSYEVQTQSSSSFTMIVNGKMVRQSSDMTKTYIFELPTTEVGPISLPSYTIKVGSKEYRTETLEFNVLPKPTSDNLLFVTQIANKQDFYYPTQIIEVHCKIYFRDFPGSPAVEDITLPILNHYGFELIPPQNPDSKLIVNGRELLVLTMKGRENIKGKAYNYFGFKLKFRLMDTGDYVFNNNIKMQVETGRTRRERGFFGLELVREKKTLYADSPPLAIKVQELPQENVPPSFNGAIGNFQIKALPSSDTDIKVGDPITLTIEISGRGTWEFVKSPPIHKIKEITDYFKVSEDLVAGEVSEDETSKTFKIRMRVKSKTVKEIPPIPFTYFDLVTMKYVTVHSDPIPISVFDATSRIQIVDFSKKLEQEDKEEQITMEIASESIQPAVTEDTEEYTPRLPELIPISDNVGGPVLLEDHAPHYFMVIYAFCPLAMVLVLFLVKLYQSRNKSAKIIAREKSRGAYKKFIANCSKLKNDTIDLINFYRDLGNNIHIFLEERLMLTITQLDRSFFQELIEDNKINPQVAESLLSILDKIDQHRYSKDYGNQREAKAILDETKKLLKKCQAEERGGKT